jgi:hypothetical protein
VITDREALDALADLGDLARALVPGDEGGGLRQHAAHRGQVRVAQAGGPHPHPDLPRTGGGEFHPGVDLQLLLPCLVQNCCAHVGSLYGWVGCCQSWVTTVSDSTGASARSTEVAVTTSWPSSSQIRTRSVSPGKNTPAKRVR